MLLEAVLEVLEVLEVTEGMEVMEVELIFVLRLSSDCPEADPAAETEVMF